MTILITGAGGFIGLNLAEQLLARGDDVVAVTLDPLPAAAVAAFARLPGHLTTRAVDVRDAVRVAEVVAAHRPRALLHAAALTPGPAAAPERATAVIDVNVGGTAAVLRAARAAGVGRVILTSSTAVLGDAPFGSEPVTEATAPAPLSLYGFSKLAAERLAVQARTADGLDVIRVRLTAIFGPWEHDTGVRDTLSPPLQIAAAAAAGTPTTIAAGGARDWTYAGDIARALLALLDAERPAHDLYQLGVGEIWHPRRLCAALAPRFPGWSWREAAADEAPTIAYHDALDRIRRSPPAPTRFVAEFGLLFRPIDAAIADYAAWFAAGQPACPPVPWPANFCPRWP
ncbi:MAG: NAD-dependent epimerase/dehydratase family protein [Lautropia sp.]